MKKASFPSRNGQNIIISATLNSPQGFDESTRYPAVVVSHPGGGVKEQTAGRYAKKLAEKGFVTIAYEALSQGESKGEPGQLENPYIRTEDVCGAIDSMTTLTDVDRERIGEMGICAGAGDTANATIIDRRIKAMGSVSEVNTGSMFRKGWDSNIKDADATPALENGSKARTAEAGGAVFVTMPRVPLRKEDAPNRELEQAWQYYHTRWAQYPIAPGFATARSLNQIITYDAYSKAEAFLGQPLQIVAGSMAGSKGMSDDLYKRAASKEKNFHVMEGASHMSLYDIPKSRDEAISLPSPFFQSTL
jgi:uncharacterized protein